MESRVNYLVVGIFVISLTALLLVTIYWLTQSSNKDYAYYYVYMNEAVSGLTKDAPVKFNGVEVGSVTNICLNPKNPQQVQLLLQIEKETPINQSTTATLMTQGITGVTYVGLKAKAPTAPPLQKPADSQFPVIPSTPSLLLELDTAIREATHTLQQMGDVLDKVFDKENQKSLKEFLANMDQISTVLSKNSRQIDASIKSAQVFLKNTAAASKNFQVTVQSINQTMGSIAEQSVPSFNQSMDKLQQVLINLELISTELQNNPSMLVRGKTPTPLGPGEK